MTVESVTYISDLDDTNPASGDSRVEGDDHIRNIKTGLLGSFPNFTGAAVTVTEAELNGLDITTLGTVEASKVVTVDTNRMVKNLLLDEATTFIADSTDTTKQVKFETSSATTATVTTITVSQTANRTITLPNATTTLVGQDTTDTLSNKTLTSPVLNGSISGTGVLDENNMASNSDTALATQQSIKAYVDTEVAGVLFTESYETSSPPTIGTSTNNYSESHGLSGIPKIYTISMRCTSADNGYSVDDEVLVSGIAGATGADWSIWADATDVGIATNSANWSTLGAFIAQKTGAAGTADMNDWAWVIRAYY